MNDDDQLRSYMETRFEIFEVNIEKALSAVRELATIHAESHAREHKSSDTAINKAEESVNRRLEGMNEFRQALKDQQLLFMPRTEFQSGFIGLGQRADSNAERIRNLEIASKDFLTTLAFTRWTEREEGQVREDRKQRTAILVGVGLSVLGTAVSIVLALTT